jgi:hypothetical protein
VKGAGSAGEIAPRARIPPGIPTSPALAKVRLAAARAACGSTVCPDKSFPPASARPAHRGIGLPFEIAAVVFHGSAMSPRASSAAARTYSARGNWRLASRRIVSRARSIRRRRAVRQGCTARSPHRDAPPGPADSSAAMSAAAAPLNGAPLAGAEDEFKHQVKGTERARTGSDRRVGAGTGLGDPIEVLANQSEQAPCGGESRHGFHDFAQAEFGLSPVLCGHGLPRALPCLPGVAGRPPGRFGNARSTGVSGAERPIRENRFSGRKIGVEIDPVRLVARKAGTQEALAQRKAGAPAGSGE